MGKIVYLAVAGAGKTTMLVNSTSANRRTLLLTYTTQNVGTLRDKVIDKYGFVPALFHIMTLDRYLYSYCFRPLHANKHRVRYISYDHTLPRVGGLPRYISSGGALYRGRLAKFLSEFGSDDITRRMNKYYDQLIIDEIQDFAANDFNFLEHMCAGAIDMVGAGDFYQHTFDSSTDGNTRQSLHADYAQYVKDLKALGLVVDSTSLNKSRRCPPKLCTAIQDKLGIRIESSSASESEVVHITDFGSIRSIHKNDSIVKLFWQEHRKYRCFSNNWRLSKGLDYYNDVCVVLTQKATDFWMKGTALEPVSRNALYVALTRARGNVYLVSLPDFNKALGVTQNRMAKKKTSV